MLKSENRDIFLIADFNYDTFKSRLYQSKNIEAENSTDILSEFNLIYTYHNIYCLWGAIKNCFGFTLNSFFM